MTLTLIGAGSADRWLVWTQLEQECLVELFRRAFPESIRRKAGYDDAEDYPNSVANWHSHLRCFDAARKKVAGVAFDEERTARQLTLINPERYSGKHLVHGVGAA